MKSKVGVGGTSRRQLEWLMLSIVWGPGSIMRCG